MSSSSISFIKVTKVYASWRMIEGIISHPSLSNSDGSNYPTITDQIRKDIAYFQLQAEELRIHKFQEKIAQMRPFKADSAYLDRSRSWASRAYLKAWQLRTYVG